jgi:hypothetical protein
MLGHASTTMTLDVYADLFPDDIDSVAAALDLAAQRHIVSLDEPSTLGESSAGGNRVPRAALSLQRTSRTKRGLRLLVT